MAAPARSTGSENGGEIVIWCWNVRNLTNKMARQGTTGNGYFLKHRIDMIRNNIKLFNPTIIFLIEAGIDAQDVGQEITSGTKYTSFSSDQTGVEKYLAIVRDDCIGQFKSMGLKGPEGKNRKGWLVEIHGVKLLVLHATYLPDPTDVIINVLKSCPPPDIYLGDFNVTNEKSPLFESKMNSCGFILGGPKENTSLRNAKTIILTGDTGSQGYDRFWVNNGFAGRNQKFLVKKNLRVPGLATNHLSEWFMGLITEATCVKTEVGASTRSDSVMPGKEYNDLFIEIKNMIRDINGFKEVLRLKTNRTDYIGMVTNVCEYFDSKSKTALLTSEYNYLIYKMRTLVERLELLKNYIMQNANDDALELSDATVYSLCLSDHWPIVMSFTK